MSGISLFVIRYLLFVGDVIIASSFVLRRRCSFRNRNTHRLILRPRCNHRLILRPRCNHRLILLFALLLLSCSATPNPANGWAIVAVDPGTGDVGVAAASCIEYPFDYRAALVPGKGALVQLGVSSPLQRDRASAWIEAPLDAQAIAQDITALTNDPGAEKRQYGIVTWQENTVKVATFQGKENAPWAGGLLDANAAVAVQGSGLVSANVVRASLDAFTAHAYSALPLPDKLMRALEAGSAAGGSTLCSQDSVLQTASSAFLMLARGGDPKFQSTALGTPASLQPNPPYLALSITEPIGGLNAVGLLRSYYDEWRQDHLPACAECDAARIPVPEGRSIIPAEDEWLAENALWLVAAFVVLVMLTTILYFALRPRYRR